MSGRRPRTLVVLAALWVIVFFALYVVFVHTSAGRRLDDGIFGAPPQHSTWLRLSGALVGSEAVWASAGVGVAIAIGAWRRRPRQLLIGLAAFAVSVLMAELLKHVLLSRPRTGSATTVINSFPSGHTTVVTSLVVALWFVASDGWRRVIAVIGPAPCVLVGLVTMIQQWHRPSDVLAAYALVAAFACLGGAVLVQSGDSRVDAPR